MCLKLFIVTPGTSYGARALWLEWRTSLKYILKLIFDYSLQKLIQNNEKKFDNLFQVIYYIIAVPPRVPFCTNRLLHFELAKKYASQTQKSTSSYRKRECQINTRNWTCLIAIRRSHSSNIEVRGYA
jgi:hypothetical protein